MNNQPRNKILILIIGILLLANIATLSFFLVNRCDKPKQVKYERREMVMRFLQKEVGFSKEQMGRYEEMSKLHREEMRKSFDGMSAQRERVFKGLALADFTDSAIQVAAGDISSQQKEFELLMLRHMNNIRSICTPEQRATFDSGFYKIISKRGVREKK